MKVHHPLPAALLSLAAATAVTVVSGPAAAHPGHEQERHAEHRSKSVSSKSKKGPSAATARLSPALIGAPLNQEQVERNQQLHRQEVGQSAAADAEATQAKAEVDPCNGTRPQFSTASGPALVDLVKNSSTDCVRKFFRTTDPENSLVFTEDKMATVAHALRTTAGSYPGNNSTSALQMVFFLRAGFYQKWQLANSNVVKPAVRGALDTLFAQPRFKDVNDDNGAVAAEAILLISNALDQGRYLSVLADTFNRYNGTWNDYRNMKGVLTNAHTVLYDATNNELAEFVAAIPTRTDVADALFNLYARNRAVIGTANSYLIHNDVRELGRLLAYGEPLKSRVRGHLKTILGQTTLPGPSGATWLEAASMANYYDSANCSSYNLCNFGEILKAKLLPIEHNCSPSLRIRAQDLTPEQVQSSCQALAAQETYFHDRLKTNRQPIPGDVNSTLELVIFDSSTDYETYSGTMFGNRTDNGGMYLEGDSTRPGNQARFLAYEAEWLRVKGQFKIWNLEHEYVHYLDGRFNTKGNYIHAMRSDPTSWDSAPINSVWYTEGLAEYISKKDDNPDAIAKQKEKNYTFSAIWQTPDDPWDVDRVYRGGYLGVRFMFERHWADMQTMLNYFRAGDYNGYQAWLRALGTRYDAEFAGWFADLASGNSIVTLQSGSGVPMPNTDQGKLRGYTINVPFGTARLDFKLSGGTGEADLYAKYGVPVAMNNYEYYSWNDGNNETISIKAPSAGKWYSAVNARGAYSGASLVAQVVPASACALGDGNVAARGCVVQGLGSGLRFVPFWLPAGAQNLKIETSGGSGDVDLYVGQGFYPNVYPNDGRYTAASTAIGNTESIYLRYPVANSWYYLTLTPKSPFSGVSLFINYELPAE